MKGRAGGCLREGVKASRTVTLGWKSEGGSLTASTCVAVTAQGSHSVGPFLSLKENTVVRALYPSLTLQVLLCWLCHPEVTM